MFHKFFNLVVFAETIFFTFIMKNQYFQYVYTCILYLLTFQKYKDCQFFRDDIKLISGINHSEKKTYDQLPEEHCLTESCHFYIFKF